MTTSQQLIDKLSDGFQDKLDSLNAARDAANAAANNVYEQSLSTNGFNGLNFDANAPDGGTGSLASPLNSWAGIVEKLEKGKRNLINIHTDLIVDTFHELAAPPSGIYISTHASVLERKKVILKDSINSPTLCGGAKFFGAALDVNLFRVDVKLDTQRSGGLFELQNTQIIFKIQNVDFTKSDTNAAAFIKRAPGDASVVSFTALGLVVGDCGDQIFDGVSAGTSFDNYFWLFSNISNF